MPFQGPAQHGRRPLTQAAGNLTLLFGCKISTLCSCACCTLPADVNHAYGSLHLHGTKHKSVPVHLEYSRPDESMHLKLITNEAGADGCVLVFDAETASDASLHPIPGAQAARVQRAA